MLQRVQNPDFVDSLSARIGATAQESALIDALEDCRHPKAERLLCRLVQHPEGAEMEHLRLDVLALLTLTFGKEEALRRLQYA